MKVVCLCLLWLTLLAPGGEAQDRAEPRFRFHFRFAFAFSPSEVLAHDTVLRLTPEQVSFIHAEVRRIQDGFRLPFQQVQDAQARLDQLLLAPDVDEDRVLATLDRILAMEAQLKRLQLRLLLRVRSVLTPAQRAQLIDLGSIP